MFTEKETLIQENNVTYRKLLPELIKEHKNKWILITEGKFIGIFDTREEALGEIKKRNFHNRCSLLSPIVAHKRKVSFGFGRKVR